MIRQGFLTPKEVRACQRYDTKRKHYFTISGPNVDNLEIDSFQEWATRMSSPYREYVEWKAEYFSQYRTKILSDYTPIGNTCHHCQSSGNIESKFHPGTCTNCGAPL